jgi:hypothetical protein
MPGSACSRRPRRPTSSGSPGESVVYTNWAPGEPNFFETPLWQFVHYWTRDFGEGPLWSWNNEGNDGFFVAENRNRYGFIVEWDVSAEVEEVAIDIKPGSFPNTINPKSTSVIPVAILTTDTFDATAVDPLSVQFGPNGATETHNKGHIEDVNQDGEPDLVLHFRTQATGIQCGDTSASLTGETFDGDAIQGSDSIKTVGCKK